MSDVAIFENLLDSHFIRKINSFKEKRAQCLRKKEAIRILHNNIRKTKEKKEKLEFAIQTKKIECETLLLSNQHMTAEIQDVSAELSEVEDMVMNLSLEKKKLETVKEVKIEEAEKKHISLRKALAYYKQRLHCYLETDEHADSDCTFHFFTSSKNSSSDSYYVKLQNCNGSWKVLEMKPEVICQEEISKSLADSGDIVSFLTHVRHLYTEHKRKSKH